MITPSTSAPHGGLSNVDARHASRAESDGGFEATLERTRERARTREPERAGADDATRSKTHDAQRAHERPVDDDPEQARDTEEVSDATDASDGRDDVSASDDAAPARAEVAGSTSTSSTRTTARGTASSAPDAADDVAGSAPLVPVLPTATPAIAAPVVAPTTLGANAASAPTVASGSHPSTHPDAATRADAAVAAQPDASAPISAESPVDALADAAPSRGDSARESAPSALAIAARHASATPDVAAAAPPPPVVVPRFTPAELPQFLRDLQVRVDGAANTAFVELEPLELGRLTVELSLQPEGGVRADVRAERPAGYAAIEARLPELRETLVGRGFATADVQVSLGLEQRDARRETDSGRNARPRRDSGRAIDTARVLALAPGRDGSIDLWA